MADRDDQGRRRDDRPPPGRRSGPPRSTDGSARRGGPPAGGGRPERGRTTGRGARTGGGRPERGTGRTGDGADRRGGPRPDGADGRSRRREEPALPDEVTGSELDRRVRSELASLSKLNAEAVARHLVMAGRLLDEDPEAAYRHAVAARDRAGRVAAVREAAGLTAYHAGRFAEALAELRAARRISGDQSLLPVMADCERGLGRPEKAIALATSPEARGLDAAGRAEMLIVASGARRDLGQPEAAAVLLQGPELNPTRRRSWSARLFYAYAEALAAAGREQEAWDWLRHAADADEAGETDAAERLAEHAGVTFVDEQPEE